MSANAFVCRRLDWRSLLFLYLRTKVIYKEEGEYIVDTNIDSPCPAAPSKMCTAF